MTSVVIQGDERGTYSRENVLCQRNAGWPTGGDPYGHGVLVVVRAGESPGMAKEDRCQRPSEGIMRPKLSEPHRPTGEPDAVKAARPVRKGADGKVG